MTQITASRKERTNFKTGEVKPPKERIARKCLSNFCSNTIFVSQGQRLGIGQFCKECRG